MEEAASASTPVQQPTSSLQALQASHSPSSLSPPASLLSTPPTPHSPPTPYSDRGSTGYMHANPRLVTPYLTQHSILPSSQVAYRKMHSTEDALVLAANRWLMAQQERKYTGIVMVDMSKAFDRVQHQRLIDKLFTLGVNGRVLLWLASYLSGRSQRVKLCEALSDAVPCSRGVPQGSVLRPLLFVLYTSDISDVIPSIVVYQEFADDIILDFSDSDLDTVCKTLTTAVTRLSDWLSEIGLLPNTGKTQVMVIQPRGTHWQHPSR